MRLTPGCAPTARDPERLEAGLDPAGFTMSEFAALFASVVRSPTRKALCPAARRLARRHVPGREDKEVGQSDRHVGRRAGAHDGVKKSLTRRAAEPNPSIDLNKQSLLSEFKQY